MWESSGRSGSVDATVTISAADVPALPKRQRGSVFSVSTSKPAAYTVTSVWASVAPLTGCSDAFAGGV